ncbi:MAG: hypothetical protein R2778_10715 [Saprospiraceae bacterium]
MARNTVFEDWMYILMQLIHLGQIEIAYDDHNRLRVGEEGEKGTLQRKKCRWPCRSPKPKHPNAHPSEWRKPKPQVLRDELFQVLSGLRRQLASSAECRLI